MGTTRRELLVSPHPSRSCSSSTKVRTCNRPVGQETPKVATRKALLTKQAGSHAVLSRPGGIRRSWHANAANDAPSTDIRIRSEDASGQRWFVTICNMNAWIVERHLSCRRAFAPAVSIAPAFGQSRRCRQAPPPSLPAVQAFCREPSIAYRWAVR